MIGMKIRAIPNPIELNTSYRFLCTSVIHEIVN